MSKKLDTNKLLIGIKKDFNRENNSSDNTENIVRKIHENIADEKEKIDDTEETTRTTFDIPKPLYKKMKMRQVELDKTMKDYLLDLVEKDLQLK